MELKVIQQREAEDSTHYWPDHKDGHEYLGICLAGEVGEVCNDIKKYSRGTYDWDDLVDHLDGELADVLIYLVMLAEFFEIDLEEAYKRKKAFNDRRYAAVTRTEPLPESGSSSQPTS